MRQSDQVSHGDIARRAWPLILANCSVPLLGLADTAVLGNFGSLFDLGAVALGAVIFSFVYWGFGFLRMGTTGFVAQADGAADTAEVRAVIIRSLVLAILLGIVLSALQRPLAEISLAFLSGGEQVEATAATYFLIRIWGAPATLGTFVLVGALIGLGENRWLLLVQLFLNILNIVLDVYLAGYLGMGARGIAIGTLLAEWLAFLFALLVVARLLADRRSDAESFFVPQRLGNWQRLQKMLSANSDIMIRTVLLVFAFAWFTNQSARYGAVVLAANHILLQLISFSAFFLDGFAFVGESLVGRAVGARDADAFDVAVRRTTVMALLTAMVLALAVVGGGQYLVYALTDIDAVRRMASDLVYFAAIYILVSFAAFQLDGIFIGATRTRQMRDAAVISTAIFLVCWWLLTERYGLPGLWWAFIVYVGIRALALLLYFPSLRRSLRYPE